MNLLVGGKDLRFMWHLSSVFDWWKGEGLEPSIGPPGLFPFLFVFNKCQVSGLAEDDFDPPLTMGASILSFGHQ